MNKPLQSSVAKSQ